MAKTHLDWLELANNSANPTEIDSTRRGIAAVGTSLKFWTGSTWATVGLVETQTEAIAVTVAAAATSGTGTCTSGSIILGYYPTGNQDQFVDSIAISGTTVTVTLGAAATADNTFAVVCLKA